MLYLEIISDSRIRHIVSKGSKYSFHFPLIQKKCHEEIASTLNDFGDRWCTREYVEPHVLKAWKVSFFKIVDNVLNFTHKILIVHF